METYYSTGLSQHLPSRGRSVVCLPATADRMIAKGYLVKTREELYDQPEAVVEEEAIQDADSEQEVVNSEPSYTVTITKPEKPEKPKKDVKPRAKAKRPVAKSRKK